MRRIAAPLAKELRALPASDGDEVGSRLPQSGSVSSKGPKPCHDGRGRKHRVKLRAASPKALSRGEQTCQRLLAPDVFDPDCWILISTRTRQKSQWCEDPKDCEALDIWKRADWTHQSAINNSVAAVCFEVYRARASVASLSSRHLE